MKHQPTIIFESRYNEKTPERLRNYLLTTAQLSGRSLRKAFFKGLIRLNRRPAHSEAMVKNGDVVQVYGQTEFTTTLQPESLPIEVIYQGPDLLILNKPALLPVHPSGRVTNGTLANRVAAYYQAQQLKIKVHPVNRLDYGTSGLIIFAKSATIQAKLSNAIQQHQIKRVYYAIVQGAPIPKAGNITALIGQSHGKRSVVTSGGQSAETAYRTIRQFSDTSLVELELQTGRTHQIRIHLSHIGCPIIGDATYGVKSRLINRPALHAGKLIFNTPEFMVPELTVPLPEDMTKLLEMLE